MASFPSIHIPGEAWPALPRGANESFWSLYQQLDRTQWLAPDEIVAGQLEQVRCLLAHCVQNVPYYRDLLGDASIDPQNILTLEDFRRIPLLKRATYQQQFDQMKAVALPAGMQKVAESSSSGSSGVPVKVWQTDCVQRWWLACSVRDLQMCGLDPRGVLASLRALHKAIPLEAALAGVRSDCWHTHLNAIVKTGPSFAMDVRQDPRRQLEWLMQVKPDYLLSFPSNLTFLADLLRETGQRIPNLKIIQAIAESLTDECRAHIERAFGIPVKNTYSCAEAGYLASPCPLCLGMHVHAENVLVEILDDADRPCLPGQTGRVIVTTLHNHATPFIRYDIGDTATLGPERSPCGRGLPLLMKVQGRERPLFRLADGRVVSSSPFAMALRGLDLCYQYQVVQRALDHFIVRLIPNRRWTEDSSARVIQFVQDFLRTPVRVDVEIVEKLTGPGGKVRDLVSELPR